MRIAFLVHAFPVLSGTFILNQVTGLLDAGHEVDIYASRTGNGAKVHADVRRYRLLERTYYWNRRRGYLMSGIKALGVIGWRRPDVLIRALGAGRRGRRAWSLGLLHGSVAFVRQKPYDIVHCQFGTLGWTAAALHDIGAVNGKLVVSFRGSDLTTRRRVPAYTETFEKGHLFLPVCERFKEELIGQGCDPRKIRVHHSGIKLARFAYRERRRIDDEPIKLLTVARLVEKKGVGYAIQATARLKAAGRRVLYTVVGDGPLRSELDLMIDKSGLRGAVHLAGPKSHEEVVALLQDAHLVVVPSVTAESGDQEGIPNVLKEAMATGIPVIGTHHSGIPELVEDGVSGLLVAERDSEGLADRLGYLIDHPERWPAMGRAGRERVEAEFDSEKLNERLVELYREVLSDDIPRP